MDMHKIFHLKAAEHPFFSSAHGIFLRIDHMLSHKTNYSKSKKIEIISTVFTDQNAVRLEMNHKNKTAKTTNIKRLNNMLLNTHWITKEIKEEI